MIKRKQITETFGDSTAGYSIELTNKYTVKDFVEEVISNDSEWGYIGINKKGFIFGEPKCEYKHSVLLSELPISIMDKEIINAEAHGGWSNMSYILDINE